MISVVFLAHLVTLVDTGKMRTYVRIPAGLRGDNSSLYNCYINNRTQINVTIYLDLPIGCTT